MKKRTLEWYKEATAKNDVWIARIERAEAFEKNRK